MRLRRPYGLALLASALVAPLPASSQVPAVRPPVSQTPLEDFRLPPAEAPSQPPRAPILPPLPAPPPDGQLSSALRVQVREFRITGNTVFADSELEPLLAPYTGREISSAELQEARQALTLFYVERGYVNSGAVIPDQKVQDGVVELRLVEGRLAGVEIQGTRWFRPSYFEKRLMIDADLPLQIGRLEERLQLLQQDERIRRLNARLAPGAKRGEALLRVRIEEAIPIDLGLEWANDEPVSVGEQTGRIRLDFTNLTGFGDELRSVVALTEGLTDARVHYRVPLNKWDMALEGRFRISDSDIIEEPFAQAGFHSLTRTFGVGGSQPLTRTPSTDLEVAIFGEGRRSKTENADGPIAFPGSGADPDTGETTVSVLRLGGQWLQRTRTQVFALRSLASIGLPVLGATSNPGRLPDSRFVSWLTQLQWVRRFPGFFDLELVLRSDLQMSSDPLVPMEQIAVGGRHTVRGYRENQLVRDQAVIGSLELRYPLWRSTGERHVIQLAPFVDTGHGWNKGRFTPDPKTITGIGAGLRYRFRRILLAEIYYGANLQNVFEGQEKSLQSRGISFRLRFDPL
jgi:hemolysin activation/secretion protein